MVVSSIPQLRSIRALDRKTGLTVNLVPSQSVAGKYHIIRTDRCDCRGFQARGRCSHLTQVRAERGLQDGGPAALAVSRAAGNWPPLSAETRAKAAIYTSIFGSDGDA